MPNSKKEVKSKDDIYTIIGSNIKKYRKKHGYTGEKLAELCNLSYGYIKNLESKKVRATISIETLKLIADKLDEKIIKFFEE